MLREEDKATKNNRTVVGNSERDAAPVQTKQRKLQRFVLGKE